MSIREFKLTIKELMSTLPFSYMFYKEIKAQLLEKVLEEYLNLLKMIISSFILLIMELLD
jgi:hypothetical protein